MLRQAMQESIMQNKNNNKRENKGIFSGSPKLSHKRAKMDSNNMDKPCCSKSLENVNYDDEKCGGLSEKSSKSSNNSNKSSGKSTTLPQGSIITAAATETETTVDDDDDVIQ